MKAMSTAAGRQGGAGRTLAAALYATRAATEPHC